MDKDVVLVFLCGARDYHAMDWYRSAQKLFPNKAIVLLTDLIGGEKFKNLLNDKDIVHKLIKLDNFLFRSPSRLGDVWRNILKLLVMPLQILLVKRFHSSHPGAVFHAHSMYYLWLAWGAGVKYVGTPQGSDILVKPHRSRIYRFLSVRALKAAYAVTVDSEAMAEGVRRLANVDCKIIQNGVDVETISAIVNENAENARSKIVSMRGMSPLYRIDEILRARNRAKVQSETGIDLIYPFFDDAYKSTVAKLLKPHDTDWGRLARNEMYRLFRQATLVISIPSSDSSPRSVYEAIFCGAAVAITHNRYYDALPSCMKARVIMVDLNDDDWFGDAMTKAHHIVSSVYVPSSTALAVFDQVRSFRILSQLVYQ